MSSFERNVSFEDACVERIAAYFKPLLAQAGLSLMLVQRTKDQTRKQGLLRDLQKAVGDAMVLQDGRIHRTVDFKCERKASRNLFVETYSNLDLEGRLAPGWLHHLQTDEIWYFFADTGDLHRICLPRLRAWLGEVVQPKCGGPRQVRLMGFREVLQQSHAQPNRTVGRLVPIAALASAADADGKPVLLKSYVLPAAGTGAPEGASDPISPP